MVNYTLEGVAGSITGGDTLYVTPIWPSASEIEAMNLAAEVEDEAISQRQEFDQGR